MEYDIAICQLSHVQKTESSNDNHEKDRKQSFTGVVVSTHLKNISQLRLLFPIYAQIKNV